MVKHELRVESLKARIEIQKCEFESMSHEFNSTSPNAQFYELQDQIHELRV